MEENNNVQEAAPKKKLKIKLPEVQLPKINIEKLKRIRLKKSAKIVLAGLALLILVVYAMLTIPGMVDRSNLKKLGYSEEAIEKIYELEWEGMILEGELFSENLNRSITKESFRKAINYYPERMEEYIVSL